MRTIAMLLLLSGGASAKEHRWQCRRCDQPESTIGATGKIADDAMLIRWAPVLDDGTIEQSWAPTLVYFDLSMIPPSDRPTTVLNTNGWMVAKIYDDGRIFHSPPWDFIPPKGLRP